MSEATADIEKPPSATKRTAKFADGDVAAEKSLEESDKGMSILSDVSAMQQTVHDMNGLPFRNLNKVGHPNHGNLPNAAEHGPTSCLIRRPVLGFHKP